MKSPMIKHLGLPNPDRYSDLQVLRSPAGWYVGTRYKDENLEEAGTRDTDYFPTEQHAKEYLTMLEGSPVEVATQLLRVFP